VTPSAQIASLLTRSASRQPGRVALSHAHAELTYRQLDDAATRLAEALGVRPGETVAVAAPNVPALVVGLFACWREGAVAVPLSARLRSFELERALADAEPAAIVSVAEHGGFALGETLQSLARRTPGVRKCLILDDLGSVVGETRLRTRAPSQALEHTLACILYTSGSTGAPKGALLPHALAHAAACNLAERLGEDADAPFGLPVPASHAFGLACLLCGIGAGATAVLLDGGGASTSLVQTLRRSRARVLHGTPTLFAKLLRSGVALPARTGFTAGSLCPPHVLRGLEERRLRLLNLYGMSEIGAATCCRREDDEAVRYGSVGRPLRGYEIRIAPAPPAGGEGAVADAPAVSAADRDATAPGEIQVRSPLIASGYHRRPWGPIELAEPGWFRTGDLGSVDAEGNLTIAGRAKEVVQVGGYNVFPAEVEAFLSTHPAIAQAAVVGAEHAVHGEALQAFVAPMAGADLRERDVIEFARSGIAGYKVPYTVTLVEEIPLLASGKPDRHALRSGEGAAGPLRTAHQ